MGFWLRFWLTLYLGFCSLIVAVCSYAYFLAFPHMHNWLFATLALGACFVLWTLRPRGSVQIEDNRSTLRFCNECEEWQAGGGQCRYRKGVGFFTAWLCPTCQAKFRTTPESEDAVFL
jgi:hypothetical protein